jgi:hypothetical protein
MKDIKKIIFVVFIVVLFVPLLVKSFNLIKEKPLGGVYSVTEKPILNDSTWFSGKFQSQQEKYLNEHIGLHNTMVRLKNQIDFNFYSKTSAEKIIVGKDQYLFENNYIFATTGTDYIGDGRIDTLTTKAKQAQDILAANGIKMLVVFAPGKASYFKEYIPDRFFVNGDNPKTNYKQIKTKCDKNKINNIDFNSWFMSMKGKSKYPLFPKAGIHWTYYGMYLCADSISKKTEFDLGKDLPEINIVNIEVSKEQKNTEYDLGELANLLFPINTYNLAYPTYSYNQEAKYRPNVLVIGDSFYWNMYLSGIPANIFNNQEFWYYNSKYYNDGTNNLKAEVSSLNYLQEIMKYEYVIILQTDGGLNNFGFGFFDRIINAFNSNDLPEGVLRYIKAIKNDPKWLASIEEKAKQRGISVDEMIEIDARYMYENE